MRASLGGKARADLQVFRGMSDEVAVAVLVHPRSNSSQVLSLTASLSSRSDIGRFFFTKIDFSISAEKKDCSLKRC